MQRKKNVWPIDRRKQPSNVTLSEEVQMLNLLYIFKQAIINTFKETKETMLKEIKEEALTVSPLIENIKRLLEIMTFSID